MKNIVITTFTKIFIAILVAVLLIALCLNLSTLWRVHKIGLGETMEGGYAVAVIGSGSMEPALRKGDLLLLRAGGGLGLGDIMTYVSRGGSLITHRVVGHAEAGFITQGDANNIPDEAVAQQRVLGRVVGVLPGAGGWMDGLISPLGLAATGTMYLLFRLVRKARENRKDEAPSHRYLDAP